MQPARELRSYASREGAKAPEYGEAREAPPHPQYESAATSGRAGSAQTLPRRLNLGCGWDKRPAYLNVDLQAFHAPDLVADIADLSSLPSGYFEEIVAQDVLEHLERHKTIGALREWSRLLAPGGLLILRVPSLLHLSRCLLLPEGHPAEVAEELVHKIFGTQAYTGDYHLNGFTPQILHKYLSDAGLQICRAEVYSGWLFDIAARKTNRLGDPVEFLHNAYFRILDRPPSKAEIGGYTALLSQGGVTCDMIEIWLSESDEVKNRSLGEDRRYAQLLQENDRLRRHIETIRTSTSWRITGPMRKLVRAFRTKTSHKRDSSVGHES